MKLRPVAFVLICAAMICALSVPAQAATKKKAASMATPISFVYAGDSITARSDSWLSQMQSDARFQAVGGYAHSGYRSDEVLANIGTVPQADVAVIELGTNDINQNVRASTILTNIDSVVTKLHANHVLIVALPPSDITADTTTGTNRQRDGFTFNRWLSTHAANKGWLYGDPFQFVRSYDNGYDDGTSVEGVHPTADTNVRVEKLMGLFIQQAALAAKS